MIEMGESERRYGQWAGNPNGDKQDPTKCIEEVFPDHQYNSRQCRFKKKFGDYCGFHKLKEGEPR